MAKDTTAKRLGSLRAVSMMRERPGLSLAKAAAEAGVTPQGVVAFAGAALFKQGGGWRVTMADRLPRVMKVHTQGRTTFVTVRGSRKASELSAYHQAVRRFRDTGDDSVLRRFEGKSVAGHPYETDPDVLEELARRGYLTTEHIYRMSAT